jgi:hypothetical protein
VEDIPSIVIKNFKCSKCKKVNNLHYITEVFEELMEYEVEGALRSPIGYRTAGNITALEVTCRCGHKWRPRGISNVWSLDLDS